jgi:hypothetical protein
MQKKIIIICIALFIASSFWLFYQSGKQNNPNFGRDWWAVYFANPKDNSLNFAIENHSAKNSFHWELLNGTNVIQKGDLNISKGETVNSNFQDLNSSDFKDKKISVKVSADDETKEIYKNL